MSRPIAHVYCVATLNDSRITTELVDGVLVVRLHISENNYQHLAQELGQLLIGREVKKFDCGPLPSSHTELFLTVCRRINQNDANSEYRQATNNVFQNLMQNQQNRSQWQQIVSNLGSAIINLASPPMHTAPQIPAIPIVHAPQPSVETSIVSLISQLGQIAGAVSRNNTGQQHISGNEILQRFTENRSGSVREIIPLVPAQIDPLAQPSIPAQIAPIALENVVGLQRMRNERQEIPLIIIQRLAVNINDKIINKRLKHPKFSLGTYANRKKIKNFIHQHTSIWLSTGEIKMFLAELMQVNSMYFS
jgi:hypothetical protein